MNENDINRLFQCYPVLRELDEKLLKTTLSRASLKPVPAGQMLFTENDACAAFPFMLSGSIRVFKLSESGRELPLYRVRPGDACVVSSGCLLHHKPYNARGRVQEDCEIVMLPEKDFEQLMSIAVFRTYVFSLFGQRLQDLINAWPVCC
ncbi:Crp/Fnr family transcriptional regulator [Pseudoteredinibacter isoporae]|uniref:CRP-like cAMP-binding protein n=1 Tax=Pseudoteredinibacter isoporae TaxID=570281 RepID=A0A7X0JUT1_9GAMM|nr:cyclic nucleotide-binding domain-containing protein [Pseudoteredinibacter isoporae]MBB6522654.1 CRP-like cAMP-binding protein [Pseudoteredinibacter isoporae]NHO88185.1 cyclic nucleotide-binding domain-containing protein [Pseudoteredinibacter isoporae]NIB23484.1 cyclic nucleotide-binding domain-containing protein [Pseudoteredinibacter isoporae]